MAKPRDLIALLALLLLAGCADQSHYPTGSPGPGTGGTVKPGPDAAAAGGADAGTGVISGTVCARGGVLPSSCPTLTGATGLTITVRETGAQATVGSDGTFNLAGVPGVARATLLTSGTTVYYGSTLSVALDSRGAAQVTVPILSRQDADTLAATNVGGLQAGTGILVVHTGSGVTVTAGAASVFYDLGTAPLLSVAGPTTASGTAVVFGAVGTQVLSLTRASTGAQVPATAEVFPGAVTFLEAPL